MHRLHKLDGAGQVYCVVREGYTDEDLQRDRMEIQLLKAKGNSGELLAAYTEWYGDNEDEDWCYLSINLINSVNVKKNLCFLFAEYGSILFQIDSTTSAITNQYGKSWNDNDELIWEPTLGIEKPEQMPKHMSIFGRLSEYINNSRKVFEGNNEKGNQMSTSEREQLDGNNYIWEGESSGPLEIWKTPQNNVNEIDFMLEKISEATNTTDLPLKKLAETKEAVEGNEEESTHEIFLAYRDKDSSFEEEDLLWLIITTERPGSDALYVLVRSSAIGQGQQIDKFIKYTNKASTILLADSSGEPWSKQLEISDKTKDFTEVKIDPNQSWSEEDTNALEELNRQCSSYMENVYSEDKGTYFKPQIKKLSLLEESDADIGDSGVHHVNKLATTGFDDEILSNLIECEGILL